MPTPRVQYAMAASVVALAVAVPAVMQMMPLSPRPEIVERVPEQPTPPSEPARRDVGVTNNKVAALPSPMAVNRTELTEATKSPAPNETVIAGLATPPPPPASKPQAAPLAAPAAKGELDATARAFRPVEKSTGGKTDDRVLRGQIAQAQQQAQQRAAPSKIGAAMPERARIVDLAHPEPFVAQADEHRDQHTAFEDGSVKQVATEPVSTFSIDVDTASYSFTRKALNAGHLPQKNAVRVEEMINYFPYAYPAPESASVPFAPAVSIFPAPWNAAHKLVHIGIKGYTLQSAERPRANLVFLIDTSGSMSPQDRLPLVKNAFRLLLDQLKPDDTVGIVTYAGNTSVALKPTKAADKGEILSAIDGLGAGGSTAGAQGIQDAYALAEANFDATGVNRIILATDGDFNVGITDRNELKSFVERKRAKGIFLSILGVGMGNYNDAMMQTLAQNGNGVAAYIDTLAEARKVLVEEASSSLFTIAKDVKIQVEFNPAAVSEYRLIGYETRALKREDFNNDKVDAGDVGSGHTVTAIYEITPVGSEAASVDPLRYGPQDAVRRRVEAASEFGFLKLRYKLPKEDASKLLTLPLTTALEKPSLSEASPDARFSIAIAGFGQLLRGSPHIKGFGTDDVIALAQSAKGDDPFGYRAEFITLARLAKSARP